MPATGHRVRDAHSDGRRNDGDVVAEAPPAHISFDDLQLARINLSQTLQTFFYFSELFLYLILFWEYAQYIFFSLKIFLILRYNMLYLRTHFV